MATTIKLVNGGLAAITAWLQATSTMQYVGWGIGTTPAAAADTALQTPSIMNPTTRVTGTKSQQTTTTTNDTFRVVATITASSSLAVTECGIFDAVGTGSPPTGGNLFTHVVHDAVNVTSGDSIQYTINHVLASG